MFWEGFYKRASRVTLGTKGLRSGAVVGNKPTSMVSMVGDTKANPLPTPVTHSASNISAPNLNTSDTIKKVPIAKRKRSGVGETHI